MRVVVLLSWLTLTLVLGAAQAAGETRGVYPLTTEKEGALKPKDAFKECEVCPEVVVIPAGQFTMGSPEAEESHLDPEEPQHLVTFAQPFAAGAFAVTFDEWDACLADGGCVGYRPLDQGWGRGRRPVINVSWHDAQTYVAWLSRKTGKTYRLLSEAEREYAARAGTATPFWWGSSISTEQANYDGNLVYGRGPKGEFRQRTLPVDSFQANPWGLYQVHGNVWEWTADTSEHTAVVRGGSWSSEAPHLRAAFRGQMAREFSYDYIGFRCVRG